MRNKLLKIATVICSFSVLCAYASIANANSGDGSSNIVASYYNDDPAMKSSESAVNRNKTTTIKTTKTTKVTKNKKVKPTKKGKTKGRKSKVKSPAKGGNVNLGKRSRGRNKAR